MRGAIAAGHEVTARAGAQALVQGGNAVDAVVAAGAMSWAAEPALTGPCGGGFVMVRPAATGRAVLLDAFTSKPGIDLPADRRLTEIEEINVPFDERTTQIFHVGSATCAVRRRSALPRTSSTNCPMPPLTIYWCRFLMRGFCP